MFNELPEGSSTLRSDSEEPISILAEQKLGVSIRPKGILQQSSSRRHAAGPSQTHPGLFGIDF
jgi:hypothetical protein